MKHELKHESKSWSNTPKFQLKKHEAKQLFVCDPVNGNIYWRYPKQGRTLTKPIGSNCNGYLRIIMNTKTTAQRLRCHNIIWNYFKGKIPEGYCIDHINRNKMDNRLVNLRCITYQQNQWQNERVEKGIV